MFVNTFYVSLVLEACLISAFSLAENMRVRREATGKLNCVHMESRGGDYWYQADGGDIGVCGFYIIGNSDQVVELEFSQFNIGCEAEGLLTIVNGWELKGEFFPDIRDHTAPAKDVYRAYCGKTSPARMRHAFVSAQNAAMVQFKIPKKGQGFKVTVRFLPNLQPCNVISLYQEGFYTLHNYGKKINCTFSIIYPVQVNILAIDVGESFGTPIAMNRDTGILTNCQSYRDPDYVELLDGTGLSPVFMSREAQICGLSTYTQFSKKLGCQNSVVRMVSSGQYMNSVTFEFRELLPRDTICKAGSPTA